MPKLVLAYGFYTAYIIYRILSQKLRFQYNKSKWKRKALKVSVVIRTRDKEKYFGRLLENLGLQTVQASEIIVVNNILRKKTANL